MKLLTRYASNPVELHQHTPARTYENDRIQFPRIVRARRDLMKAVVALPHTVTPPVITELGCGTADISGPFSYLCPVYGYEINSKAAEIAARRWPKMAVYLNAIPKTSDGLGGVVVLCEVLEHLENPLEIVKGWCRNADAMVVSHPLNEALDSDLSGGEHRWSFDFDDFQNWFTAAEQQLQELEQFQMGKYEMIIGWGTRR